MNETEVAIFCTESTEDELRLILAILNLVDLQHTALYQAIVVRLREL